MSGGHRVSLEALERAIEDMTSLNRWLESMVSDVDGRVNRMQRMWEGEAALAQHAAHREWLDAVADMRAGLAVMTRIGGDAHSNYRAAVSANTAMWG